MCMKKLFKFIKFYFFGIPLPLWQVLFFLLPFLFLFVISFWRIQNYQLSPSVSFDNYFYIFSNLTVIKSFMRSLLVIILTAIISISLAYPFVYFLVFFFKSKYSILIIFLTFIPLITSYILRSYSWRVILSDNGLINVFLLKLGLINSPLKLQYTLFSTELGFIGYYFPISVLFLYLSFSFFDKELISAAKDLGANSFNTFKMVTLPLSFPALAFGGAFTAILVLADFITPTIVGGNSIYLYSLHLKDVILINNWPRAAAMGILMAAFVVLLIVISAKTSLRRMKKSYSRK